MKKVLYKIFHINKIVAISLCLFSAIFLIYVFSKHLEGTTIAYISYLLSAYSLVLFIIWFIKTCEFSIEKFKSSLIYLIYDKNRNIITRYILIISSITNLVFGVFEFGIGLYYRSWWFITFALYYLVLCVLKFILINGPEKFGEDKKLESTKLKTTGLISLLLNFILIGMIILIIRENMHLTYAGSLIYLVAMYDFYLIISAIINVFKYKKDNSPVIFASKCLSLTIAMISILSLSVAMIYKFGGSKSDLIVRMTGILGFVIFLVNSIMSINMIIRSKRKEAKMKSGIYRGKKDIEVIETGIPKVGKNDILIKNIYSSICGTDVAVYFHGTNTGHKVDVGGEFGHETISKVVGVGKNVENINIGDIVYPYPLYAKDDIKRAGTLGGFSEYILIPNCVLNKSVYKLKDNISIKEACLIEPFTVGCRGARRSYPKKGENAIVFGSGTIGIASAISLKHFGCNKVMIVDISDFRLNIAKSLGFEICNSSKEDLLEIATNYFGESYSRHGKTCDVDIFIDCAGADSIIETYQNIGKIESRLVVVAVLSWKRPIDVLDMTYSQHSIIGSGGYFPVDVLDVMNIMSSKKWNIESIITNEYSINNLEKAIEKAGDINNSLNVIVDFKKQ